MKKILCLILTILMSTSPILADRLLNNIKEQYYSEMANKEEFDTDTRIIWYDSLLHLPGTDRIEIMLKQAATLRDAGNPLRARQIIESIRDDAMKGSLHDRLHHLYQYGLALSESHDYKKVIAVMDDILSIKKPDSLKVIDVKTKIMGSEAYTELGDYDKAHNILDNALEDLRDRRDNSPMKKNLECRIYGCKATINMLQHDFDSAFRNLKAEEKLAYNDTLKRLVNIHYAQIFEAKGEPEMALKYANEALKCSSDNYNLRTTLLINAICLYKLRRYEEALAMLTDVAKIGDSSLINMFTYYKLRGDILARLGDYEAAFYSNDTTCMLADSIILKTSQLMHENSHEYFKTIDQLKESEANASKRNIAIICLTIIAVVISVIAIVLAKRYKKFKREVEENKELIDKSMSLQQEIDAMKAVTQNEKMEYKRNYSSVLMKLSAINSGIDEIRKTVAAPTNNAEKVAQIKKMLRQLNIKENLWQIFSTQFEDSNRMFIDRLTSLHPDLSKTELRVCSFILINLSTKEIAELLNRSPRTIEATKYNIRKKLDIEEPTETYLLRLASTTRHEEP